MTIFRQASSNASDANSRCQTIKERAWPAPRQNEPMPSAQCDSTPIAEEKRRAKPTAHIAEGVHVVFRLKAFGLRRHPSPNENRASRNPAERRFSNVATSAASMSDKAVRVTSPRRRLSQARETRRTQAWRGLWLRCGRKGTFARSFRLAWVCAREAHLQKSLAIRDPDGYWVKARRQIHLLLMEFTYSDVSWVNGRRRKV